jgi:hypothetical protein
MNISSKKNENQFSLLNHLFLEVNLIMTKKLVSRDKYFDNCSNLVTAPLANEIFFCVMT